MLLLHSLIGDAFVIWVFYNIQSGSCCRPRSYHCLVMAGFVLVTYEYGVWPVSSEGTITPVSARSVCLWVVSICKGFRWVHCLVQHVLSVDEGFPS